jgi:hypothetical protein
MLYLHGIDVGIRQKFYSVTSWPPLILIFTAYTTQELLLRGYESINILFH